MTLSFDELLDDEFMPPFDASRLPPIDPENHVYTTDWGDVPKAIPELAAVTMRNAPMLHNVPGLYSGERPVLVGSTRTERGTTCATAQREADPRCVHAFMKTAASSASIHALASLATLLIPVKPGRRDVEK